jgi:GT2 family glycosyltransferase
MEIFTLPDDALEGESIHQNGKCMIDEKASNVKAPLVYCIVLNWNGWEDTLVCLESLMLQDYPNLVVVVVDNCSHNDSVAKISQAYPSILLLETGANLGFSGGNNVGIRLALDHGAEYVWLLNNDTIAPFDTATKLVAKALSDPQTGEVGTVLHHMHSPRTVQAWGGAILYPWAFYRAQLVTTPHKFGSNTALMAASVLLRREALMQVGLLDEGFFMYYEDSDLSFRIYKAGWTLTVAENTAVLHKEGASLGALSPVRVRYGIASTLRFMYKHARLPALTQAMFCMVVVLNKTRKRDWRALKGVLAGIEDAWKSQYCDAGK